jgi:ataxia telangiectasia mutated family protein
MCVEKSVITRRKACDELQQLLATPEVRRKLALEGTPARGTTRNLRASRHRALSELWRNIVQHAMVFIDMILDDKKVKLNRNDVTIPLKLIKLCHLYDEGIDYRAGSKLQPPSRLSRSEIKKVIAFVFGLVDDDRPLALAEVDLLDMLAFICSRREYVANMKPVPEMQIILEEVETRLLVEDESVYPSDPTHVAYACKAFQNLMKTSNELGVGLHLLVPGTIKMVMRWIRRKNKEHVLPSVVEFVPILEGLTGMVRSHPHQCMAPLARHGKTIIKAALKRYSNALSFERRALNGFFSSMLIVSEIAGKVQGLSHGDLGALGEATLDLSIVWSMLEMVMKDPDRVIDSDSSRSDTMKKGQRDQLELLARLLACAQRLYLLKNVWKDVADPTELCKSFLENQPDPYDLMRSRDEQSLPNEFTSSVIVESPMVALILKQLYEWGHGGVLGNAVDHPVFDSLKNQDPKSTEIDSSRAVFFLNILSVASELFPNGSCWFMSSETEWFSVDNVDDPDAENGQMPLCRPADMALLVGVVGSILERHGGLDGDVNVQKAALSCLDRLAHATSVHSFLRRNAEPVDWNCLQSTWRGVWQCLFRQDFRYSAYTKNTSEKSTGSFFLRLLTTVVQGLCTDPSMRWCTSSTDRRISFILQRQADVWRLPVFARSRGVETGHVFRLLWAMLSNVGLSESGEDTILSVAQLDEEVMEAELLDQSKRYRLAVFCTEVIAACGPQSVSSLACSCLAAIANGNAAWAALDKDSLVYDRSSYNFFTEDPHSKSQSMWSPEEYVQEPFDARVTVIHSGLVDMHQRLLQMLCKAMDMQNENSIDVVSHIQSHAYRNHFCSRIARISFHVLEAARDVEEPAILMKAWSLQLELRIALSNGLDPGSQELLGLWERISEMFKCVAVEVSQISTDHSLFILFKIVLGISQSLNGWFAHTSTSCPLMVVENATLVRNACRAFLDQYVVGDFADDNGSSLHDKKSDTGMEDSLFFENDGDDFALSSRSDPSTKGLDSRKRKRRNTETYRYSPTNPNDKEGRPSPSLPLALVLAELLVALDPSMESCRYVGCALLGIEKIGDNETADPEGGFCALLVCAKRSCLMQSLILQKRVLSVDPTSVVVEKSMTSLICFVIAAIRSNSPPESHLHLYGYDVCASIVKFMASYGVRARLTPFEVQELTRLLGTSPSPSCLRTLAHRPPLRIMQMRAAVSSFRAGDDVFHRNFDKSFPILFVLPSLCDIDDLVRREGCNAVGAAIKILPEKKVHDSVKRSLFPIFEAQTEPITKQAYTDWYSNKTLGLGEDRSTMVHQVWNDAFLSVRTSVLDCWISIGATVADEWTLSQIMFNLIQYAKMSLEHELISLQVLDGIASRFGYRRADSLVEEHIDGLMRMWIEGGYAILDLPLILTAPNLLRQILHYGGVPCWNRLNYSALYEAAAFEFSSRYCRVIMPQVLHRLARQSLHLRTEEEVQKLLLEDHQIKDLCSVFFDHANYETLGRLIRANAAPLLAYCVSLRSLAQRNDETADEMERVVTLIVTDKVLNHIGQREAHIVFRELLRGFVYGSELGKISHDDAVSRLHTAFSNLATRLCDHEKGTFSALSTLGCTAVEFTLFAKVWLHRTIGKSGKDRCLVVLDVMSKVLLVSCPSQTDLFISTISELLLWPEQEPIHLGIVVILRKLLSDFSKPSDERPTSSRFSIVSKDMLGVVMHAHETAQGKLLDHTAKIKIARQALLQRSFGLMSPLNEPALNLLENSMDLTFAERQVIDTVTKTYEFFQYIFENFAALNAIPDALVGAMPPYEVEPNAREILVQTGSNLCAQVLVQNFLSQQAGEGLCKLPIIIQRLRRKDCQPYIESRGASGCRSFPVKERILKAELLELEDFLRSGLPPNCLLYIEKGEFNSVVWLLSGYCGPTFSSEVRLLSTRCLSRIRPFQLDSVPIIATPNSLICSIQDDGLISFLQAKCLSVLVKCLSASDGNIAICAIESLFALSGIVKLSEYSRYLGEDDLRLLRPLFSCGVNRKTKTAAVSTLSALEVYKLKSDTSPMDPVDKDWCWNESLWRRGSDTGTSFENWICKLVPSLLLCNFKPDNLPLNGRSREGLNFCVMCVRMSLLEPQFAASVFPLVISDLLIGSRLKSKESSIKWRAPFQGDHFELISSSFGALLPAHFQNNGSLTGIEIFNRRTLELAVDTLNLLRLTAQEQFTHFNGHVKNLSALEGDSIASEGKKLSDPAVMVPFSCGLRVDGLSIATACIFIKRFASALLYAEAYTDYRFCDQSENSNLAHPISVEDSVATNVEADFNASEFFRLYKEGLSAIGDRDDWIAADCLLSEFRFRELKGVIDAPSVALEEAPSLARLQSLDTFTSLGRRSGFSSINLVTCLESAGLPFTMQSFMSGMGRLKGNMPNESERVQLREKWFETCLHDLNWDIELLEKEPSVVAKAVARLEGDCVPPVASFGLWKLSIHDCFHESVAKAVASYIKGEQALARGWLVDARMQLATKFNISITKEAPLSKAFHILDKTCALREFDVAISWDESNEEPIPADPYEEQIDSKSCVQGADFQDSLREIMLRLAYSKALTKVSQRKLESKLFSHLWSVCRQNCESQRLHVADVALKRLFKLLQFVQREGPGTLPQVVPLCRLRLQEAIILERKGDFAGAIRHAKQTVKYLQREKLDDSAGALLADSLILCGGWMATYKVEPASSILESYLKPGTSLAKNALKRGITTETQKLLTRAYLAQAQLVSNLFDTTSLRVKSLEWHRAGVTLGERETELKTCERLIDDAIKSTKQDQKRGNKRLSKEASKVSDDAKDLLLYRNTLARETSMARLERNNVQASIETYRSLTSKCIVAALLVGAPDEGQIASRFMYRLIHLWFSCEDEGSSNGSLVEIMAEAVTRLPSFRFVPATSQLLSRVEKRNTGSFQETLHTLILRMCHDHPYNCLVQVVSLANGKTIGSGVSGRQAEVFLENTSDTKVDGANEILASLRTSERKPLGRLMEGYISLTDAYVHLAMYPTHDFQKAKNKKFPFSAVSKSHAERLDQCLGVGRRKVPHPPCVLTKPPPIRPASDYTDETGQLIGSESVVGFEQAFSITESGLHRPKIVYCLGSKGGRFKQLVKGEDEIRQDAVMEQVFGYVNELLSNGDLSDSLNEIRRTTGAGHLRLVTYNIVPLSPASGVLEWVDHTIPFGEFMMDKKGHVGAHSRYYPGQWSSLVCREQLRKAPKKEKLQAFNAICLNHSPVFRYFFVERFGHTPELWHEARMRYTRSVAVNSIVGHILGIGDRHCSNILIHEGTGEVVHIDFGIVFEQGKLLNTPELVPFRLTQNTVDGFGPVGLDGTFTKSAQRTLSVLRKNSNALLTILSAIVSDPLYKWSVSPVKARLRQEQQQHQDEEEQGENKRTSMTTTTSSTKVSRSQGQENEAASHAIRRIQEKLQGYEDGTSGEQQSVEGQVQLLINSAKNKDNLCLMFCGWAPWV